MKDSIVVDILGFGGIAMVGAGVYLDYGIGASLIVVGALALTLALVSAVRG